MLIAAVVAVGRLEEFDLEELSSMWSALIVAHDDEKFFATFDAEQQKDVSDALKAVEKELKRRNCQPLNFFKMLEENPAQVEYYLKQFELEKLLELAEDLKEYKNVKLVDDFCKLVNNEIYRRIPVA